jgi:hypothetical protein
VSRRARRPDPRRRHQLALLVVAGTLSLVSVMLVATDTRPDFVGPWLASHTARASARAAARAAARTARADSAAACAHPPAPNDTVARRCRSETAAPRRAR